MEKYNPKDFEAKWRAFWEKSGIYRDYDRGKKFYALDMFPYPSGAGLHVGHPKGYIATDVVSRFKMLNGYSVLHPMGWDAFGLPAENYAIKNKVHPRIAVEENIATFKKQLEAFGFTYDWEREINTTDPEYYRWTQWIFLKMFEKGLAYESEEPVNWCPSCKTVLANEDLEKGLCERCGSQVVQKKLRQWVLKMTEYADRLLYDLDDPKLDWEEMIRDQQRNWIGRSEGATVKFLISNSPNSPNKIPDSEIENSRQYVEVFTTRVDTIFGCTYCVVAPEHALLENCKNQIENYEEVEAYIIKSQMKTELERTELQKEKTGVELRGLKAINPFNGEAVPVWVADYVLGHYGTGAVMAVPAHDIRDYEFSVKYNLPIREVIISKSDSETQNAKRKAQNGNSKLKTQEIFIDDGILADSGEYSGLVSREAREKMTAWLSKNNLGEKKINYKMRDWVFSRQRYWGEPIPIVHCDACGTVAVPEEQLPVKLPEVEHYEPTGTGEGPLAAIDNWVNTTCPKCGGVAKRETNTMPQWAGSSWYYLRYIDPKNSQSLIDSEKEKKWMPVDLYVGGAEHATRHLLYARFWHKFLFDIGAVSTSEPFKKLVHVGLILAEDGRKMSKRWGNVINPDEVISQFGADAMRVYEMFMGPFTQNIAWNTKGLKGAYRFLEKVWKIQNRISNSPNSPNSPSKIPNSKLDSLVHKTIKKVGEDIENFRFNTAISSLMILANAFEKEEQISLMHYTCYLILLSSFAPHLAEELWLRTQNKADLTQNKTEKINNNYQSIFLQEWPKYDPEMIRDEEIELVIQINGKVRDKMTVSADLSEEDAKKLALESENVKRHIDGKEVKKIIFIKGKLVSIVI